MTIEHIFNEVDTNENKFYIKNGCFDVSYIEEVIKAFDENKNICEVGKCNNLNEEAKNALIPIDENTIIDVYDDEKINSILKSFNFDELYLVNGDFFGIQKFIFSDLSTKRAAKILRARSAMVLLITKVISMILEEKLGAKLVLFGAGKFLMISEKIDGLEEIEKELNKMFFNRYFGESGVILSYEQTSKEELKSQDSKGMKETLEKLGVRNEEAKYNKFNSYLNEKNVIINIFENAKKEDEICEFCKKRVKEKESCNVCENEINLGTLLTKRDFLKIIKVDNSYKIQEDEIVILEFKEHKYIAKFLKNAEEGVFDISNSKMTKLPKWSLKSYVPLNNGVIKTFEEIEENSSGLMVLKADVDRLGKTFKNFYYNSFKKFNRLSRELNFFFSNYVPYMIVQNKTYKENIYVVFAGGDDLFLIGRYDVVVEFAKELREKFYKFSLKKSTLSMGLVMFKSSTPISYVSEWADEAERKAKQVKDKSGNDRDGICLFDIEMKFDEFLDIENKLKTILPQDVNMSVLYKLIEIIEMAEKVEEDVKNSMWISKLVYLVKRRNLSEEFIKDMKILIQTYKKKVLPSLYLQIYKRRDNV